MYLRTRGDVPAVIPVLSRSHQGIRAMEARNGASCHKQGDAGPASGPASADSTTAQSPACAERSLHTYTCRLAAQDAALAGLINRTSVDGDMTSPLNGDSFSHNISEPRTLHTRHTTAVAGCSSSSSCCSDNAAWLRTSPALACRLQHTTQQTVGASKTATRAATDRAMRVCASVCVSPQGLKYACLTVGHP